MIKNNGWINTLLTLVLIAIPALIGFLFNVSWMKKENNFQYYWYLITSIGFIIYAIIISIILIKLKILAYQSIAFMIPVALVLSALFLTAKIDISTGWDATIKIIVGIVAMLSAFPLNIYASNLRDKKVYELKKRYQKNIKK